MALKTFNTLIKLHKRRVDVLRREMIAIEKNRDQLIALSAALHEEHQREMLLAGENAAMAGFFGSYSKRVAQRHEALRVEIEKLNEQIEAKAELIRTEFAEQKRYEVAREYEKKRLAHIAMVRQQERFDEIATQQYLKHQS